MATLDPTTSPNWAALQTKRTEWQNAIDGSEDKATKREEMKELLRKVNADLGFDFPDPE